MGRDQPAKEVASRVALTIQALDVAKIQSNDIVKVEATLAPNASRVPSPTNSLHCNSRRKTQAVAIAIGIPTRDSVYSPARGRIAD